LTTAALALALALPATAATPASARPAAQGSDSSVRIDQKKHRKGKEGTSARRHSLTLAPFRTSWPAAHLRYELRLRPKLGIDLGAGFGRWRPMAVRVAGNIADIDIPDIDLVEMEAAINTYPAGRFHRGMQLGLTVRQQWASTTVATSSGGALAMADAQARVFTVGPHIGVKRIWPSGFTLQARVGGGYAVANADVDAVAMFGPLLGTEQVGGSYGGPIVFGNAGIGWSF
jgi:hypothetical protein